MNHSVDFSLPAVLVTLVVASSGCGGSAEEYDVVPVSGVVTCNGEPVPFAAVQFMPLGNQQRADGRPGRSAFATADVSGKFELSTYDKYDGAIVGKHRVTIGISMMDDSPGDLTEEFECKGAEMEVTIDEPIENMQLDFTSGK